MKRSLKFVATAVTAAATLSLTVPAAHAASSDTQLYPQSGRIYIDPVSVQVLAATPSAEIASAGADLVLSTVGPATTVAFLGAAEHLIENDVRRAARHPGAGVEYRWQISDGGAVVNSASRVITR
ncbi:MAG: hypothetical protein ACI38U_09465 [Corynebacterium sp.]|uniref:hypothetical protein n=1 Tax=unclassified Corynebacterium TaxID=2624378 RepID=UPI000965178E|nr:hypothetical protein [Corynebacterium sp. CNJ-954]OLT56050.1 hypothetical protein BJF89_13195 [Corynebacterium sp. CNJ-954]